jgi:hypothetical protein
VNERCKKPSTGFLFLVETRLGRSALGFVLPEVGYLDLNKGETGRTYVAQGSWFDGMWVCHFGGTWGLISAHFLGAGARPMSGTCSGSDLTSLEAESISSWVLLPAMDLPGKVSPSGQFRMESQTPLLRTHAGSVLPIGKSVSPIRASSGFYSSIRKSYGRC